MNEEYHRLEAEARVVELKITGLIDSAGEAIDTDGVRLEAELRRLHQRLDGLRQGMMLIRRVESREMRKQEKQFIAGLAEDKKGSGLIDLG